MINDTYDNLNLINNPFTPDELKQIAKELNLNYTWSLYYHVKNNLKLYNDNTYKMIDINTIADFWGTFNNVPIPSIFFYDGVNYKKIKKTDETPAAYSFFKNNIFPAWEEELNINGFEFSFKIFDIKMIDDKWINLLLFIINNNYNYIEYLNGVRIVDCSYSNKAVYRIEIWYSDINYKNIIEQNFKKDFETYNFKIFYREHKILKEK